ncbi:MAG: MMPL family transporter [Acidobacteriota bacterium]|nr:MMPL family transporter [Acidobacteriota bacterium]MDE3093434.1 MMPL family transporter [Acidobacteriota bacterium]MDE3146191.1 MMPL family transporter [Acidobacteriota bacterium]
MKSLARFSVRRRWLVLVIWIVLIVGVNAAAQAAGSAYSNSFSLPGTDSTHALHLLEVGFPHASGDSDQIVFHSSNGALRADAAAITPVLSDVKSLSAVGSVSPVQYSTTDPAIGYVTVTFTKQANLLTTKEIQNVVDVASKLRSSTLQVDFGGNAFGQLSSPKGSPGEGVGLLLTAVVLFLAFGSLWAMLLPLGVALFAIGIASGATTLLSHGLSIAQFAPILGSLIGLGVGIDYALFIVTRARQNLRQGMSVEDAIVTAVNTSGRAVLFAGATVCVALLGMLVLGFSFLDGLGVAASVTVLITMLAALTLLPSLLAFQKHRVLSRRERRRLANEGPEAALVEGGWQRWALYVSRHPRSLSLGSLVVIVLIALPIFTLNLGISDQGSDPAGSTTRVAYDYLAQGFGPGSNGPLLVVGDVRTSADVATMTSLAQSLRSAPDVASVGPVTLNPAKTVALVTVISKSSPQSRTTTSLIDAIRSQYVPRATATTHTAIYVGGSRALSDDFSNILDSKIPLFLVVIVLLGCLLLMVAFRSVVIPLVAALMNLLAVGASFGLVVAVFQWGWGSQLIGSGSGPIESYLPIIMIAILFGLSMDYQVFLVSRMHEEWVNTGDNEMSIIHGQANTGRVITAAALIMISVFFSFAFGGQRIIAEFGIGLGGAVLLDAFILRTILVPSLMHYLGRANWWMPSWLDRVVPHVAVEAGEEA